MSNSVATLQSFFVLGRNSSKNTKELKKKAVERVRNNNLLLSLVIAFLIVIVASFLLSFAYRGLAGMESDLLRDNNRGLYMMDRG